jgi:undecaprenyl-diphosphatase
MYLISSDWFWIPLYFLIIYLIINKFKKKAVLPILFIILAIVASDQISGVIKKGVKRPRPTHNIEIAHRVHTVNQYTGGAYGFVSSHASNTFCLALFIVLLLSLSFRTSVVFVLWASLVSYSRVYLGVHYPSDIVAGAFLGAFLGIIAYLIHKRIQVSLFYTQ